MRLSKSRSQPFLLATRIRPDRKTPKRKKIQHFAILNRSSKDSSPFLYRFLDSFTPRINPCLGWSLQAKCFVLLRNQPSLNSLAGFIFERSPEEKKSFKPHFSFTVSFTSSTNSKGKHSPPPAHPYLFRSSFHIWRITRAYFSFH